MAPTQGLAPSDSGQIPWLHNLAARVWTVQLSASKLRMSRRGSLTAHLLQAAQRPLQPQRQPRGGQQKVLELAGTFATENSRRVHFCYLRAAACLRSRCGRAATKLGCSVTNFTSVFRESRAGAQASVPQTSDR